VGKNKPRKFADMKSFPNVVQNFTYDEPQLIAAGNKEVDLAGKWNENHFEKNQPITVELACGRGEYTVGLAKKYPNRNFIGIDIKGARMHWGAKHALDHNLKNTAFLRTRIEIIDEFFHANEVDEIWITFPDPFLKKSKANRRLTHSFFINKYRQFLIPGGIIHLKTDSFPLFNFTLNEILHIPDCELIISEADIYDKELPHKDLDIRTKYEKMHLNDGLSIKYIQIKLS